jgi:hypothetical protein
LVEQLGPSAGPGELALTTSILTAPDEDGDANPKNYHAWAHRQWALAALGMWESHGAAELEFSAALLESDVRNNSAWNHRWFVLTRCATAPTIAAAEAAAGAQAGAAADGVAPISAPLVPPPAAALEAEVAFTLAALRRVTRNESAWSYLRALVRVSGVPLQAHEEALALAAALREAAAPAVNTFANELLADAWLARAASPLALAQPLPPALRSAGPVGSAAATAAADGSLATEAGCRAAAARLLAENAEFDAIRAAYWGWRVAQAASGPLGRAGG